MADRPILFSAPMVRALLAGTKTQTRRVIDFPGIDKVIDFVRVAFDRDSQVPIYEMKDASGKHVYRPAGKDMQTPHWSPRYAVGDRLWVREAWRCNGWAADVATIFYRASEGDGYTAMCEQYPVDGKKPIRVTGTWRPGIHMPRWSSRLTLTVTDVRVQRLQEISDTDALAEGVEPVSSEREDHDWSICPKCGGTGLHGALGDNLGVMEVDCAECNTHVKRYRHLWDEINADRAPWDSNPWVVAVTFNPALCNIDQVQS